MSLHELIRGRSKVKVGGPTIVDRRAALKALSIGTAAALAGCGRPSGAIVPYVDYEGDAASGAPLAYATALELSGYARGVVGVVRDGRPIKINGNPRHPMSLGSTDPFLEAGVLDLFDPQRSKTPMMGFIPTDWNTVVDRLRARLAGHAADHGAGLALLTGRVLSPTLLAQIDGLVRAFPAMRRVRWEPIHDDAERAGARMAYGRVLDLRPRLADADVIVTLDADPLGPGPAQIRLARDYAARRRPESGPISRTYALESGPSPTGVMADRRASARPEVIHDAAIALAAALGAPVVSPPLPSEAGGLVAQAARDLVAARGRALVLAGRSLAPETHALCAWMNGRLAAPLDAHAPLDPVDQDHAAGLAALAQAMHAGEVQTLIVIDSDPVYAAPPALAFREAMRRVPFVLHAGIYRGATGRAALWHAPLSHALESWGDARAVDGSASIVQPLVAPLYETRTAQWLLAQVTSTGDETSPGPYAPPSDYARVQATWRGSPGGGDFGAWWNDSLAAGVLAVPPQPPLAGLAAGLPAIRPSAASGGLTLVLRPSARVWDGRFGPNAWLQECPDPIHKETWGASVLISPADAARARITDGGSVAVSAGGRLIQAAARIDPRQGEGSATLPMGFGQTDSGPVANGIGPDAMALREPGQAFAIPGVSIVPAGSVWPPPQTQHEFRLRDGDKSVFPVIEAAGIAQPPPKTPPTDLLGTQPKGPVAWGMVVDTQVCIGCNACVVACQAENNVPVIGPDQIHANRDMHWLRVDHYELPTGEGGFQPVPCMQCEEAPCEPVCPVEASIHDSEGINDQVYNRCIGTRFCESNCPYKVRRFNFLDYQDWPIFHGLDARSITAQRNPEVTVRARGVMEKCNYCLQRISAGRRQAEKEERPIRDGEVTTACQDACPTRAISFGNLSDPAAEIHRHKGGPRHYVLLEELKTKPRTTYQARQVNPPGARA